MLGYTPIFSKIVDSSLWSEPDYVVKVFITMLAKKDRDNVCRGSAYNIAQWSRKTEAEVLDALKILSSPDTKRLEPQPFDGRRIEKVEDGWVILNGKFYQNMMVAINHRAAKAKWAAENRQSRSITPDDSQTMSNNVSESKARGLRFQKPTQAELESEGLSTIEAAKFLNFYESKGWKVGKNQMVSWKSAVSGWKLRSPGYSGANNSPPVAPAISNGKRLTKQQEQEILNEVQQ